MSTTPDVRHSGSIDSELTETAEELADEFPMAECVDTYESTDRVEVRFEPDAYGEDDCTIVHPSAVPFGFEFRYVSLHEGLVVATFRREEEDG